MVGMRGSSQPFTRAFLDQRQQVALAHQRIAEVQFVELILMGAVIVEVFAFLHPVHEEVVERTVGHKLQCAERVCHAFEEVALPWAKSYIG